MIEAFLEGRVTQNFGLELSVLLLDDGETRFTLDRPLTTEIEGDFFDPGAVTLETENATCMYGSALEEIRQMIRGRGGLGGEFGGLEFEGSIVTNTEERVTGRFEGRLMCGFNPKDPNFVSVSGKFQLPRKPREGPATGDAGDTGASGADGASASPNP